MATRKVLPQVAPEMRARARLLLQDGAPLRTVLVACGVRQADLATALGLVRPRVSRILKSEAEARKQGVTLSLKVYTLAAQALGLPVTDIPEAAVLTQVAAAAAASD